MLRLGRAFLIGGTVAAAACTAALAATHGKPVGTFNGCPTGLRPLSATYKPAARHAAITFLTTTYAKWNKERHWEMRLAGAQVGEPFLVRHWLPSGWIKTECGNGVWQRSVGVSVRFPAMEYPNPKGEDVPRAVDFRRRSRCDGQALRTIAASLVEVRAASTE